MTMIVPFAAGGQVDVLGRVLAPRLSEILGQQVVVENVGGGGGMIGSSRVARGAPDGYLFMLGSISTHAFNQTLFKQPQYNVTTDFAPVALVAETPLVLVTRKDLPAKNLKEFAAFAKAARRQGDLRLGRRRLGQSPELHPARHGDRHQDHACAVSQRRPGDAGPGRRADRLQLQRRLERAAADQRQDGEHHRHAVARADRGAAGRADRA